MGVLNQSMLLRVLSYTTIAFFVVQILWNLSEGTYLQTVNFSTLENVGLTNGVGSGMDDSRNAVGSGMGGYRNVVGSAMDGFTNIGGSVMDVSSKGDSLVKPTESNKHVANSTEVMINTYMRAGSSFLGRVLGFRSDTFYIYEPLWGISRDEYFSSSNEKCGTFQQYCRKSSGLKTAYEALDQLYDCTFYKEPMVKILTPNINVKLSGKRWSVYRECKKRRKSDVTCLTTMATKVCAVSKNKVTKVLRISLANIDAFLDSRPKMKVVHLFRDPRAMINSHMRTRWSRVRKESLRSIDAAANSICRRIEDDVKHAKVLREKFPERFIILQYEDFQEPLPKIKKLLDFLGMEFTEEVLNFIDESDKTSSVENQHGNHPFMYREQLDWKAVEIINRHCGEVFQQLGYTMFKSEKQLRDLTLSAISSTLPFTLH